MSVFEQVSQGAANTPANAWPVVVTDNTNVLGTPAHPVKVDPTGTTAQPVVQATASNLHVTAEQPTAANLKATVLNQDGSGNNLTSTGGALDSNLKTVGGSAVATGTGTSGAGVPRVTVANDSKVQLWNGTNTASIDAGGNQAVNLNEFGGSPLLIGQTNMAHSIPVVIASDQQISVAEVYNNQTGTVTSGVVPNAQDGVLNIINDIFVYSSLVLNFVLPFGEVLSLGGNFQVEGSIDGNTWTALTGTLLSSTPEQITQYTTTGFGTCSARYNLAGFPWIRLRTTQPFTGTINVQQCLTTAQGDEVGFTTAKIVDESGNAVDLTPATQYTEGQAPQAAYFQGGLATNLTSFPAQQVALAADAVYVLPKRSQIGNTLVVAAVIQGTNLTAANLAPMWLADTAGSVYTLAQLYDSTATSAGQAIAIYVKTITAVDNEGQIGLILGFNGTIGAGQPITSITGINVLAHEYSGVTVTGDAFAHVLTPASASVATSAPIAPGAGYLVYSLISAQDPSNQRTGWLTIGTGGHLATAGWQILSSDPVQACTGDNLSTYESLGMAWDWVCVKLPIATTGQIMMGRLNSADGPIQAIQIDAASGALLTKVIDNSPTSPYYVAVSNTGPLPITTTGENFPVQLQDGSSEPISSTSGSLNVNVTNESLPVTQSGLWSITATNSSITTLNAPVPAGVTMAGAANPIGAVSPLSLDASGNLKVNVEAGTISAASATGASVPADADYIGLNIGGDLVGQTGISLANAKAAAVALVDSNGNQTGTNASPLQVYVQNPSSAQNPAAGAVGLTEPNYASNTGFINGSNDLVSVSPSTPLPVTVSGTSQVSISGTSTITGTVVSKNQDGAGNNLTSTGGSLNVNVTGGSTAGAQYAAGTAVPTPTGTVALGTDGTDVRALSTTSAGVLNVAVTTPVAITGANGASVEAAQNAPAPAHVIQVGGVYNSAAPAVGNGDITALQADGNGNLKVSLAGTSVTPMVQIQSIGTNLTNTGGALNVNVANNPTNTNGASAATGSAVPASASYTGYNSGGNLVGVSSSNPLPVTIQGGSSSGTQYTAGQLSGATTTGTVAMGAYGTGASTYAMPLAVSSTGVLKVDGSATTQPVSGAINVQSSGTALTNTGGALDVNIKSGAASGTQYATGTAVATPNGTVALGFDGADVRALSTDANGNQNVNLYVGGSPNGVLHPVAISATGNANSATNPIATSVTDGTHTSVMAATGTAPATSTYSLPVAAVLYAGATPTAIGTPVAAGTGTLSGNALTCNSPIYVGTAPVSTTNLLPTSAKLTDGTTALSGAMSPLGSAPAGNAVMAVNNVALPSAAAGSALNAKFINASGAAASIKSSAGNLYGFSLTNSTAAPAYVEFFNTAATPTLGTTAVVFCVVIPASGNVTMNPSTMGLMNFSSGIGFAVTTAENGSTTAAVTGMIFYQ